MRAAPATRLPVPLRGRYSRQLSSPAKVVRRMLQISQPAELVRTEPVRESPELGLPDPDRFRSECLRWVQSCVVHCQFFNQDSHQLSSCRSLLRHGGRLGGGRIVRVRLADRWNSGQRAGGPNCQIEPHQDFTRLTLGKCCQTAFGSGALLELRLSLIDNRGR